VNAQKVVSAVVGLVIVVGGFGCRQIARNASEGVADRAAERAVEQSYDWTGPEGDGPDVDIDTDAGADEKVEVPEGWPTDLTVVDGLDVLYTTADTLGLNITGNVDGDRAETARAIEMDLVDAGFTVDDEVTADEGDGRSSTVVTATGAAHTATVSVTETPNDVHGNLTIVYLLVPTAG
jgi:hypothetical protein